MLGTAFYSYAETEPDAGYDQNIEVSFTGIVSAVSDTAPPVSGRSGFMRSRGHRPRMMLTVKSSGRIYQVIAGPSWFMKKNGIVISPGDEVSVTGAKLFGRDGSLYVISRLISVPSTGVSVLLRDSSGRPAWRRHSQ